MSIYDTLTKHEAVEDLTYFYDRLVERHPAWLDGSVDKTEAIKELYEEAIDDFTDDVTVTVLKLYQCASKMAAVLRDGHTTCFLLGEQRYINTLKQVREFGLPSMIDGIDIETIVEKSKELTSYELDAYRDYYFRNRYVVCEDTLALYGVDTQDGVIMSFDNGDTYEYRFVPANEVDGVDQSSYNQEYQWVSYTIDEDHNLGIINLKKCINNSEYRSVLDEFFQKIHEKGITNVAVDLRNNGGGDSSVANEFITYLNHTSYQGWKRAIRYGDRLEYYEGEVNKIALREDAYDGRVFILTNISTFSAAMDFGMLIQDNGFGELVGTMSGNMPHSYIDILQFQMPHSKIVMHVSYKICYRIDTSKENEPLIPDYIVDDSKALDKVYELISEKQ